MSSLLSQVTSAPLSFTNILYHHNVFNPKTKQIWIKEVKAADNNRDKIHANDDNDKTDDRKAYENTLVNPVLRVTYRFVDC